MPPYLTPLQIFENYKKANPQKCKGKSTTEICRLAGLSDKQITELKTTSAWLFCSDKENVNANQDFSMTEILGGNFSQKNITKVRPKTNFNRKIEPTFQSTKQGDCWLLSDINALNQTEWGRQAIYDAIIPDEDNSGGVTIKFKGSPLKQKEFHFTAEDIDRARNSGRYSSGDDDMIAFELAMEKIGILMEKFGMATRTTHFDSKAGYKTYIANGGVYDKDGNTMDISTFITGKKDVLLSCGIDMNVTKSILKKLADNKENAATVCTFKSESTSNREENSPVHGGHAYAIKKIVYGKFVTVIDPYHADKEIKLPWQNFISDVETLRTATKNNSIKNSLETIIPQTIKEEIVESTKEIAKSAERKFQTEKDLNLVNNIFPQVANILMNFNIKEEDILFNRINEIIQTDFLKENKFGYRHYAVSEIPFDKRHPTTRNVNKENVILLLEIKPDFIVFLDKYKSGWGNGKEKKALIEPIINALAEKAKEKKIDSKTIDDFKNKCIKELDATFYTDEKVIQCEVEKMVKLIKSKLKYSRFEKKEQPF